MAMEERAIGDEDVPGEAGLSCAGADRDAIVAGIDGAMRNQDPLGEDRVDTVRIGRIVGVFPKQLFSHLRRVHTVGLGIIIGGIIDRDAVDGHIRAAKGHEIVGWRVGEGDAFDKNPLAGVEVHQMGAPRLRRSVLFAFANPGPPGITAPKYCSRAGYHDIVGISCREHGWTGADLFHLELAG